MPRRCLAPGETFRAVDAPVVRYFSHKEITRLLNACEGAFRDLVHAALLTGCRYGELCQLKVVDYNADVETLQIGEAKADGCATSPSLGKRPSSSSELWPVAQRRDFPSG